ncbi:MAG: outer membrane lipoprotein chaperone LolA [Porticoccaceae bacterium]|nr:outer membrane lipoprotein chaperone LolA [Porticoccaceae bacterium]
MSGITIRSIKSFIKCSIKCSLLMTVAAASVQLQAAGKAEDVLALRNLLEPIHSLSAQFTQQITDAEGFELESSSGLFEVLQPTQLHWQVKQPMQQQIISDGISLWIYDPDLEQVIVQPFNQDIAATPAILFSGDLDQLDKAYLIEKESEGRFKLTPERAGSLFRSMQITFVDQRPTRIALTDNLDQTTSIEFSQLKINPPLSADQFVFQIPDGVDVINNAN